MKTKTKLYPGERDTLDTIRAKAATDPREGAAMATDWIEANRRRSAVRRAACVTAKVLDGGAPAVQGRGGARKGAGRKPVHGETTRGVTVSLPPSLVTELDLLADAAGMSRSQFYAAALRIGAGPVADGARR